MRDYINEDHPDNPTDFSSAIEPAYRKEIEGLKRGPFALIAKNKEELNSRITEHINKDFEQVEPYVDKILTHLSSQQLCVVVLDNVDLFENEDLETTVFAEGMALSKRVHCHMIVSIRDTTFSRHMSDSTFDAYELRKMWLDSPPFKEVLSKRLTYAKKILEGKRIEMEVAGKRVVIPDIGAFFDIVQHSVLEGTAGHFIESVADMNVRRGLSLITTFLTSGHIEADRAISSYYAENGYVLPFHEVFRGSMLGQWKHFREDKSDCVNLFDSRIASGNLLLLRLHIIHMLVFSARREETKTVPVSEIAKIFSYSGASENQIIEILNFLWKRALIRNQTSSPIDHDSIISITRTGAYYFQYLSRTFVYAEECMYDTAICDNTVWNELSHLTDSIENESNRGKKMSLRRERIEVFTEYLNRREEVLLVHVQNATHLKCMAEITGQIVEDAMDAEKKAKRRFNRKRE